MKFEVFNHLNDQPHTKIFKTVEFNAENTFKKYPRSNDWRVQVWVKNDKANSSEVRCGMALIRPEKNDLYEKKWRFYQGSDFKPLWES